MKKSNKKYEEEILAELWENAAFDKDSYEALEKLVKSINKKSVDIEFNKELYYSLPTSRNRNLINSEEQQKLRDTVVAYFGLSVGSHCAITWLMESRASLIKIIDPDTLSPTNLNRLRFGWNKVGLKKIDLVEEQLTQIHPLVNVVKTSKTDESAISEIFNNHPKADVVVDAIDDMLGKIFLRHHAKINKIPLISAADVGDNIVLDIERYDQTPTPEPFLGRIPDLTPDQFLVMSDLDRRKLIIKLVGFEENSEAMLNSLLGLGKDIGTWPQLGATATIAGGVITTVIKKIILGENVKSGRYYISLDKILVNDFNNPKNVSKREHLVSKIKERFDLK